MTEAAPPDVKRRRLAAADSSPHVISDLPSGILAHAASFLVDPSRALFAIALDENSATTSSPNERSSAIVGNQWDILDFGGIEKDLAEKISDSDIEGVLLCIDAVNKLKRLKFTNCVKITGTCLEPLRGSAVIEQIDLSLVGDKQQIDLDLAPLSCEHVLPVLDSIIEREGCVLKYLHFPSMWRKEPSIDSDFHTFMIRYDEMSRNRGEVHCLECSDILPKDGDTLIETETPYYDYGTQLHTCYGCLEHYCYDCNIDGAGKHMLHICDTCQRDYCIGCLEMTNCSFCGDKICQDCYKYKCCAHCDKEFCRKFVEKFKNIDKCEYCDKCYCQGCNEDDAGVQICHRCNTCYTRCCSDCLLKRYKQGQLQCTKCINRSVMTGESLERKQLQDEVKQLKVEMAELKRENKELKLENKELRSKLT